MLIERKIIDDKSFEGFTNKFRAAVGPPGHVCNIGIDSSSSTFFLPSWQVKSGPKASENLYDCGRIDFSDRGSQTVDHRQPQLVLGGRRHHPLDESLDLLVQSEMY